LIKTRKQLQCQNIAKLGTNYEGSNIMPNDATHLLKQKQFGLRTINVPTDLKQVHALFAKGMAFYSNPLPVQSPLRQMWEAYIPTSIAKDLSNIHQVYLQSGGGFWVVVDLNTTSKNIVGCVGCEPLIGGTCELRRMSVSPTVRRRGLGSLLVRVVEEFAAKHRFTELILSTGSIMAPARGLYERNGFEQYNYEPSESKAMMEANEEFGIVHFRKPITAEKGRWMWSKL
jgi:ribosomal protein S18 acetylase RimI-like enzyme